MEDRFRVRVYSRGVILSIVVIAGILLPRILPLKTAVYTNITSFLSIPGGFGWENMAESLTGQQMLSPLFQIFIIVSLLIYVPVIVMAFAKPGGLALLVLRILFALPGIAFLTCAFCQSLFLWNAIRALSAGNDLSRTFVTFLVSLLLMLSFIGLAALCFIVGVRFRSRRAWTIAILDITAFALVIQLAPVCVALWDVLNVQKQTAEAVTAFVGYLLFVISLLVFVEIILLYHRRLSLARKKAAEAASASEAQLFDTQTPGAEPTDGATPLVWQPEGGDFGGAASAPTFAAAQQQDTLLNSQPQQVFVQPMPQPTAQPQQSFTQAFGQPFETQQQQPFPPSMEQQAAQWGAQPDASFNAQQQPFMQPGQPVQQATPAAYATPQPAPPLYPQPQQAAQQPVYAEAAQYAQPATFAEVAPSQVPQAAPIQQPVYAAPQPAPQAIPPLYTAPQQAQQTAPPVYTAPQQAQQPRPFIQPAQQQPAVAFSPQPQQPLYAEAAQSAQEAPAPVWPTAPAQSGPRSYSAVPNPQSAVENAPQTAQQQAAPNPPDAPETQKQQGPKPYPSSSW